MFVYIYNVLVELHGKEAEMSHALVYAVCVQDAETMLRTTEGVIDFNEDPLHVFNQRTYVEPCVVLERTQGGKYHG